ncbi:hypothetical protein CSKR_114203 [Clonorchis sinensis]|uniref:Uncharacterized protein n=1 Tax=Clonorchis sinensis TaxID=79923 RepID=A0A419PVY8_CLOSI|nr:hypothetical protein CSKR_114203 [Clonorchis sinensis]
MIPVNRMCCTRPSDFLVNTVFKISRYMYIRNVLLIRLLKILRHLTTGFKISAMVFVFKANNIFNIRQPEDGVDIQRMQNRQPKCIVNREIFILGNATLSSEHCHSRNNPALFRALIRGEESKTLICVSFTKLNIHLLLERVFLKFPGYSLTVTQMQANATKRLHKVRDSSHFSRDARRIYEKAYYSHASSAVSTVTPVINAWFKWVPFDYNHEILVHLMRCSRWNCGAVCCFEDIFKLRHTLAQFYTYTQIVN